MVIRGAILDSVSGRHWRNATMADAADATEAVWPDYDDTLDNGRLSRVVRRAIDALDEPAQKIIGSYYAEGGTFANAGKTAGIDRRRAGEIHAAAIGHLQRSLQTAA
jgi:DNA-directed RNA polymerase specialized sigma subunit